MVGFGKKLRELQIPDWQRYYINYKMMKKKLKQYAQRVKGGKEEDRQIAFKEFSKMLDHQIEKTVLFFLEQQGYLASRLAVLGENRQLAKENGDWTCIHDLQEAYKAVGKDLLKLVHFVEINATGLRKILKKFDKHVGYRLTDYYIISRSNHPYSQLQQVFKHVGIGAMVATLSRSLVELQNRTGSFYSLMYDEPSRFSVEEPIIESIMAAEERLTNSTNFLRFLGAHALIVSDELPRVEEEAMEDQYHFMSLVLNLVNTFLYMVNTYIIVPTADKYATSLGAAATLCGVIIGAMAVAQLISSVYFSAWSNRSYFRPLIFSSVVLLVGNALYAMAYDLNALPVLLIGRLLCGFGSARAVNRRYISDWVPVKKRLQASAAFVSASALGMATGPALAGLFEINKSILGWTLNANTLPGWVMSVCWLVYLVWLWLCFKEPVRELEKDEEKHLKGVANDDDSGNIGKNEVAGGLTEPLLQVACRHEALEEDGETEIESSEDPEESSKPATSIVEAYRLLTIPVKVQLLIYFMLKFAMEILLSESSVVTSLYFSWTTRSVALFLALLGLTVLPVNVVVGTYISNIFEDRQILLAAEVMTCLGICICFNGPLAYSVEQYVTGALITFVSAEVLEGVNLSLLSKVMS
eukprot:c27255_g2_i1 orf=653-2572(+)